MEIQEYNATEAGLTDIKARMKNVVYDVTTTSGMEAAKLDRRELVSLRVNLEVLRKEKKGPALKLCKDIDSEAKTLEVEIRKLEEPIDGQIKAQEKIAKDAKEKLLNETREKTRLIMERIEKLKGLPERLEAASHTKISETIALINGVAIDEENFGEYLPIAQDAYNATSVQLIRMLGERQVADHVEAIELNDRRTEDARLKKEREDLAAEREKFEDKQKETLRIQGIKDHIEKAYGSNQLSFAQQAGEKYTPDEIQQEIDSLDVECSDETYGEFAADANSRRQTLRNLYVTAHQVAEERVAAVETKRVADETETKRLKDVADKAEKDRIAAVKEKKKSDRAARVAAAKCATASGAFQTILDIVNDEKIGNESKLDEIQVIAEANI